MRAPLLSPADAMRRFLVDHAKQLDDAAGDGSRKHAAAVEGVAEWPLRDKGTIGCTPQQSNCVDCGAGFHAHGDAPRSVFYVCVARAQACSH